MLRQTICRSLLFALCFFITGCNKECDTKSVIYSFLLISDSNVYYNNNHSAFTCLTELRGHKLLAFREGAAHRPTSTEDYGHITILQEKNAQWSKIADLSHPDMDLRDPFFVHINGNLRVYCGYNQFVNDKYQHSGTAYSDLTGTGWTPFVPIQHDVPHIVWLWKIRKYDGILYGVAYLEGEKPVLLKSTDGKLWVTAAEFQLEDVLSEADICFSEDNMYVCLRQDTPIGSLSHWGVAKYPFTLFEWKTMDISVASPELFIHPLTHNILLSGREYDLRNENKPDSVNVSLFMLDINGKAERLHVFDTGANGDKGYPSFLYKNGILYLSYYYGNSLTQVNIAEIGMTRKDE